MKKELSVLLSAIVVLAGMTGCGKTVSKNESTGYPKNKDLAAAGNVQLTLTGMTPSMKAMENVIADFTQVYPNCSINYEYVQDYSNTIVTRLANNDHVDLFLTKNIQAGSELMPYAAELNAQSDKLDLSDTFDGFIRNFSVTANGEDKLYAVPLGGEVRGLYVNKTLLSSLGLQVPGKYTELLECCRKLKAAGYIPMQGNPSNFGQLLMYPYVCSLVANAKDYSATYDQINTCQSGVSELFRLPMSRLYDLVANGYYNYKYVETAYGTFTDTTDETSARDFLNVVSKGNGTYEKKDDLGQVAFFPGTMSFKSALDKTKENYHSNIDYVFILAPVGDEGGYAYLSPSTGIAINKNSKNTAWALEFLKFLFTRENSRAFAEALNIIPNTSDALDIVNNTFRVDSNRVSQLGQVSFRYVFYDVIRKTLMDISKGNNPKYMQENGTMYDLEHYMEELEKGFAEQRT